MKSVINVTKVSFNTSKGYTHNINYVCGTTYWDLMNKINFVCRSHNKGTIICKSNYAPKSYEFDDLKKIDYVYNPKSAVSSIRDELIEILANQGNNKQGDAWFRIDYAAKKNSSAKHLKQYVTIGGRA